MWHYLFLKIVIEIDYYCQKKFISAIFELASRKAPIVSIFYLIVEA